jgi:hypothetical protein
MGVGIRFCCRAICLSLAASKAALSLRIRKLRRNAPEKALYLPSDVQILLARHFPDFDLRRVRIHIGIPSHVRLFAAITAAAYTSGDDLYFAPGVYDTTTIEGLALIAHEIAHSVQYKRYGKIKFQLLYLMHYLANKKRGMSDAQAYEEIPFEKEARAKEFAVFRWLETEGYEEE